MKWRCWRSPWHNPSVVGCQDGYQKVHALCGFVRKQGSRTTQIPKQAARQRSNTSPGTSNQSGGASHTLSLLRQRVTKQALNVIFGGHLAKLLTHTLAKILNFHVHRVNLFWPDCQGQSSGRWIWCPHSASSLQAEAWQKNRRRC